MTPRQFSLLRSYPAFCEINGYKYQEHIVRVFNKELTAKQKVEILGESDAENALLMLKAYGLNITNDPPI